MNDIIGQLAEQLNDRISHKRRSAAKKLRSLKANSAGSALLLALNHELKNKRAWETQYHMVMALGESGYTESLSFLNNLSLTDCEVSMLHVAVGDAITTLEQIVFKSPKSLPSWIDHDRKPLVEGGLRALAINRFIPEVSLIKKIVLYAQESRNEGMIFWASAASPEWPFEIKNKFLNFCLENSLLEDTRKAAEAALKGQYLKWNIL